jgi:N-acetylneuraminic acid mutarotase
VKEFAGGIFSEWLMNTKKQHCVAGERAWSWRCGVAHFIVASERITRINGFASPLLQVTVLIVNTTMNKQAKSTQIHWTMHTS